MMIRMVGGWVFLLVPAHPGSPGQRAVKRLLLLLLLYCHHCNHHLTVKILQNFQIHFGIKKTAMTSKNGQRNRQTKLRQQIPHIMCVKITANNMDVNNVKRKRSTQTLTTWPVCDSDFSESAEGSICSDGGWLWDLAAAVAEVAATVAFDWRWVPATETF